MGKPLKVIIEKPILSIEDDRLIIFVLQIGHRSNNTGNIEIRI